MASRIPRCSTNSSIQIAVALLVVLGSLVFTSSGSSRIFSTGLSEESKAIMWESE